MTLAFCSSAASAAAALPDLEIVARLLDGVLTRLDEVAAGAWQVAADVEWQSRSAGDFFARAEDWARQTVAITAYADDLRAEVQRAYATVRLAAWSCP
ncbi:hypothetical protein [Microbacterium aureliae]